MPKILIVDDDVAFSNALHEVLNEIGYTSDICNSVDSALSKITQTKYDFLITDVYMEGKTGIDMLVEIKERKISLPIIVLTQDNSLETARDAINENALYYLPKPININILKDILDKELVTTHNFLQNSKK